MRRGISAAMLSLALGALAAHAADPFDLELTAVNGSPFYIGIPGPPGVFNRGMAAGDYDGDGDTDVVVTERDGNRRGRVRLMKNTDGRGTMSFAGQFGDNFEASWIVSGDFDADGKLDAAVSIGGNTAPFGGFSGGISIFYGNGAANFPAQGFIAHGPLPGSGPCCAPPPPRHLSTNHVTTGDFNQDGRADLAASVNASFGGFVYFSINNGNRTFSNGSVGTLNIVNAIAAGDVTGDGDPDLVVGAQDGTLGFHRGLPGNNFGGFESAFSAGLGGPTRIAVGDLDGDGDRDVVVAYSNNLAVFTNSGTGVFTHAVTSSAGLGNDAAIGDLDGSPGGEILTGAGAGLGLVKLIPAAGMSPAQLKLLVPSTPTSQGSWVLLGQMNNSGPLDVMGQNSFGLSVYLNGPADSTPPEFDDVDDVTEEATSADGAIVSYTEPGAEDDVDGPVDVTCSPASGSQFALGSTEVTCEASDAAGNDSDTSFNVIVEDTTAPAVDPLDDIVAEAATAGGAEVDFDAPGASDAVDGDLATTCDPAGGSTFGLGQTTVTCGVSDAAGNDGATSFIVTVRDTTAPVVTAPADITAELTGPGGAAVEFDAAAAIDAVGVVSGPNCSAQSGDTFPLGSTSVSCSASDAAGLSGSDSFTITVVDTTAPLLTLPPSITAEQSACPGTPVSIAASASDLSGAVTLVSDAPASYPVGTTTVSFTATDGSGNQASGTVAVTIVDGTAPVIDAAAPSQSSLWPPNGRLESIDVTWSVSDCDAAASCAVVSVASDEPAAGDWNIVDGDTVQLRAKRDGKGDGRVYTITIRCTDAAGNASTRAVTVAVPHDQRK